MSERMSAWIAIGGTVPRALVPDLCEAISQEQLSQDWGDDTFEPEDEEDLTDALDDEGHLFLCDEEACWGQFDNLEKFLCQHGIAYDRHSSAKYEYDAQLDQFRPGLGILNDLASEAGRPLVDRDEVEKIRDALRAGKVEEALTLAEKLCPEVTELPPFQVVDGDIVVLMDDADVEDECQAIDKDSVGKEKDHTAEEQETSRLVELARQFGLTAENLRQIAGIEHDRLNNGGLIEVVNLILEDDDAEWLETEMKERTAEKLVSLAKRLGLKEAALDDAVHDCCQEGTLDGLNGTDDEGEQEDIIGGSEEHASAINNGGLTSQIAYLLEHNDAATVERLIRDNARRPEQ